MKTNNQITNSIIDAYIKFTVKLKREAGYYFFYLVVEEKYGENQIFDDLIQIEYLGNFHPSKRYDPDGYYSSSLDYKSKTYGLAMLKFYGNVQCKNYGVIHSKIDNADCMLYNQSKPNQFMVYILKNKKKEEGKYFNQLQNGHFDAEIKYLQLLK